MSHSRRLREKIELAAPGMHRAIHSFWTHPRMPEIFPEFLFTTYCVGRSTVPLLESAFTEANARREIDPVAACVADYCAKHIPEERHHDEGVLDDLAVLGVSRESVAARIPSPTMAAMIGAQHYWILNAHPVALLGYLEVLEGEPPVAEFLEEVIQRTGLPRKAFRTYFQHADVDRRHRDELREALDHMPLTKVHENILAISAFQTVELVRQIFEQLAGAHLKVSALKASAR
ncbi:MAG: iron-containing redox enzyme family protein [Candidatus Acidiferrales bacterium]